jgi:hypothetical protein
MVGDIIPLRRATSSRYNGRLEQESARHRALTATAMAKWRPFLQNAMDAVSGHLSAANDAIDVLDFSEKRSRPEGPWT